MTEAHVASTAHILVWSENVYRLDKKTELEYELIYRKMHKQKFGHFLVWELWRVRQRLD